MLHVAWLIYPTKTSGYIGGIDMFMEERQQQIAKIIQTSGRISISEITTQFGISDESARRDLRLLEQNGLCKRTHGGAIRIQQAGLRLPVNRDFLSMTIYDTYREIARTASSCIQKNDSIYLTSGSFGHIMLNFLPQDIPFTLTVNSVDLAQALRSFSNIDVYVAGGHMRKSGSLVDSLANEFISRMHFDTCLLTGVGLTYEFGLSNRTDETASFQRSILQNSRNHILLIPGEKVGSNGFIRVCTAKEFQTIITDWNCPEDQRKGLEELGIEVIVVAQNANS